MDHLVDAGDLEGHSSAHAANPLVGFVAQTVAGREIDERQCRQLIEKYRFPCRQFVRGGQHCH